MTIQINIIIKMEQSKSPKSLAYARLGRPHSGKNSVAESHKKVKRNSTGNIYEEILEQFQPDANKYIRDLVNKNEKQQQHQAFDNYHSRRKSYADLVVDCNSKQQEKMETRREERDTLCRPRYTVDSKQLHQETPKHLNSQLNKRVQATGKSITNSASNTNKISLNSFRRQTPKQKPSFIDNLGNYLQQLNDTQNYSRVNINNGGQKLSETLKIRPKQNENIKYISKLDQSQNKIKELKVKNYYLERQLQMCSKKEGKMKQSLYQMLDQIKGLNAKLSEEKKKRKKLQKIIDNFQLNKKPERRTIGKHYNLDTELIDSTQNDNDRSQFDEPFNKRIYKWIDSTAERRKNQKYTKIQHQSIDFDKIRKCLKNCNSEDSDD